MMFMPGFGEIYVSTRARLLTALTISLVLMPVLTPVLPEETPAGVLSFFMAVSAEILIGGFIGGLARMIQSTLHISGMMIAFQSGLAAALLFDANQGSQGSVIGNFMTLVGVTMLFVTDLHHLVLIAMAESYFLFDAGVFPPLGDFAHLMSQTLSGVFLLAVKIASPLIVVGLCMYLASGMMARLMPNMQVFFIIMPVQIYVSFYLLAITLSAGMIWYLKYFEEVMSLFASI